MKRIRGRLHPRRGERREAMGSSSTTDWLLLWTTGVANANLAFLAWIGVALRSVREWWGRSAIPPARKR